MVSEKLLDIRMDGRTERHRHLRTDGYSNEWIRIWLFQCSFDNYETIL